MLLVAIMLAHSWYPPVCCGGHDCHPTPCAEIVVSHGVWRWHDLAFANEQVLPSADDQCHVCHSPGGFGAYCLFVPGSA